MNQTPLYCRTITRDALSERPHATLAIVLSVIVVALLVGAGYTAERVAAKLADAVPVKATVNSVKTTKSEQKEGTIWSHYPTYRYRLNGTDYTVEDNQSYAQNVAGQTHTLYVNPEEPTQFLRAHTFDQYWLSFALLVLAFPVVLVLALVLRSRRIDTGIRKQVAQAHHTRRCVQGQVTRVAKLTDEAARVLQSDGWAGARKMRGRGTWVVVVASASPDAPRKVREVRSLDVKSKPKLTPGDPVEVCFGATDAEDGVLVL